MNTLKTTLVRRAFVAMGTLAVIVGAIGAPQKW